MSGTEDLPPLLPIRQSRKVLVAFDKFKGCMDAQEACQIASDAVLARFLPTQVTQCPLTDGGDGFCKILTEGADGDMVEVRVLDARHREKEAFFGVVPVENLPEGCREYLGLPEGARRIAVVEMAQASGLADLQEDLLDPWEASSVGTGLLLREAANFGVDAILLGIGGSATNDLGLGALEALGAEFYGEEGEFLSPVKPRLFTRLFEADLLSNQLPLPPLLVACDVQNPLLGPEGATTVFAPQKGLPLDQVAEMETALTHAASILCQETGKPESMLGQPGTGAAGGIGLGLMLAYETRFIPGFELVAQWFGLGEIIRDSDLVITGEGNFDESSLHGKAPWSLIGEAGKAGIPVQVYAGRVSDGIRDALPPHVSVHAITPAGLGIDAAIQQGPKLLKVSLFVNLSKSPGVA